MRTDGVSDCGVDGCHGKCDVGWWIMKEWIIRILAAACLSVLTEILLPEGNMKKTVSLITSLVMMIVILSPVAKLIAEKIPKAQIAWSGIEYDTAAAENKIEGDIKAILSGYEGYEDSFVRVTVDDTGKVTKVDITVEREQASLDTVINKDTTVRAVLAAFYRMDEKDICINGQEG